MDFTKATYLPQLQDRDSEQRNCAVSTHSLPRQAQHQRLKLLSIDFDFQASMGAGPVKFSLVQAARRQPDPDSVMDEHFHPIGATVGE